MRQRRFAIMFAAGVVVGTVLTVAASKRHVSTRPDQNCQIRPGDTGILTVAEQDTIGGATHRVLVVRTSGGDQVPLPNDKPRKAWNLRVGDNYWAFVDVPE